MATHDPRIQSLVDMYRSAYVQVFDEVVDSMNRGLTPTRRRAALYDIHSILEHLDSNTAKWIEKDIPARYKQGLTHTNTVLRRLGQPVSGIQASFSRTHTRAVEVIASNLQDSLMDATQRIGRRVEDVFRKEGIEATLGKLATQRTVGDASGRMLLGIVEAGHDGFVDRIGRHWRLDTYVDMAVRTTTREAVTAGTINQLTELGYDLVQVSEHYPTCPMCAVLQGRVYSISGKSKDYPPLVERTPFHPNCLHVTTPYIPALADDPDGDRRRSNAPMVADDPRVESERLAYNEALKRSEVQRNRRLRVNASRRERIFDKRYSDIMNSKKLSYSDRNQALREIRTAELNAMKSSEVRSAIGQGRGNWPLHRGSYHVQKHGTDFGAATIDAYQQATMNIVQNASKVYTQYHPQQQSRQWLYVLESQRRGQQVVDVVVWDQQQKRFISAWSASPERVEMYFKANPSVEVSSSSGRTI